MNTSNSSLADPRLRMVNYLHIAYFGFLVLYALYPYFQNSNFDFSWRFVSGLSESRWQSFLYQVIPTGIYSIFYLLLPLNASAILVLLAIRRNSSNISSFAYLLLALSAFLRVPLYFLQGREFSFNLYLVILVLTPVVIGIPAFLSGLTSKEPLEPYKEGIASRWMTFLLFPLFITRKTMEYSSRQQSNTFLQTLVLLLGLSLAAKAAEFIYEVLILSTVIPIGGFIVIWVAVILLLIWLALKLLGKSEGTVTTTERTTVFGRKYLSHTDDSGEEIARTEEKETLFGGKYSETRDSQGNVIAKSEEKEKLFGGKYTEHRDAEGKKIGTSEEKETFLGDKEIEHRDENGKVIGTSQKKKGLLGDDYTETEKK